MASRNHYTYTPGYQGGVRQAPSRAMDAYQDPYPRQNAYPRGVRRTSAQAARPTGDTLILALLFIVAPLCGILGIFVKTFLWIFIAVTFLVLAAMWALRCFEPRGRAFLSGILAVLAVVAFISTIDTAPRQRAFQTYGGNDQTLPAGQTGSSNAQNVQNSQGNGQSGQDSRGSQSNPNNIGFAGLPGMSPTPTAPIGPPEAGGAEYAQTGPEGEGWQADPGQPRTITTAAQEVMGKYMQMWRDRNFEDMVEYTTPEWRNLQKMPQRQLGWNHDGWLLNSWTIISEAQSPTADSVTLKVVADLTRNTSAKTHEKKEYTALVLNRNGTWFVDPDSMRNGIPAAEPQAAGELKGAAAEATPAPEPTIDPSLKLWYNSSGGKMYHLQERCPSINARNYQHMKSFKYSQLDDKDFSKLNPCGECNAPKRPK